MKKGILPLCLLVSTIVNLPDVSAQDSTPLIVKDSESTLIKRKSIVIVRKRTEKEETKGIELQNYVFLPRINVAEYYDDNVYATGNGEKSDLVTVVTPTFELKSDWQQHAFNVDAGVEVVRHADLAAENTDNLWLNMNAEYDINRGNQFLAGISYIQDHEDRGSADAEAGDGPTEFDDSLVNIGYSGSKGNQYLKLAINTRRLDFKDVDSLSGAIDYDDRDRDEDAVGLRYLFKYSPTTAFIVDTVTDRRDYRQTPDNEGNDRNSDGYRYTVGFERVASSTVVRVSVGRLTRDYRSDEFENADESDFGFQLRWKLNPTATLTAKTSQSIEETTLDNSPGYLMQNNLLRLNLSLSDEKSLIFDLIDSKADYAAISREDDYLNFGIAYSQQLLSNLKFGADLHRAERDSNIEGEDYEINQIFFRIKAAI